MTTDEFIAFWAKLGDGIVHPDDDQALLERSGFEARLIPLPWNGPIKTAKAFVAFLNPGVHPEDISREKSNDQFRQRLRQNLKGESKYVYFEPDYSDHPGAAWAHRTFGANWSHGDRDRVCIIQLVAYHSQDCRAPYKAYKTLMSTLKMKLWIRHDLLPRVRSGNAVLVVGRGARGFEVESEPNTCNFVRYEGGKCRSASMRQNTRGGKALHSFLERPLST